ncbi:hypothetical protein C9439_07790 [archaeon SCG-AAA382B04]|nr:hypothetical protein C9439_07790 [archaeon SCG-AAA382B04]
MNKKIILGLAAIGIALLLAFSGAPLAQENKVTVKELMENKTTYMDKTVQAMGIIKEDSVEPTQNGMKFTLRDKDDPSIQIQVTTDKTGGPIKSDEGKTVQATGKLVSENSFEASQLDIGCKNDYTEGVGQN